jgi:hypothetical protein
VKEIHKVVPSLQTNLFYQLKPFFDMEKKVILSTLGGLVVLFLLGGLAYGVLLAGVYADWTKSLGDCV